MAQGFFKFFFFFCVCRKTSSKGASCIVGSERLHIALATPHCNSLGTTITHLSSCTNTQSLQYNTFSFHPDEFSPQSHAQGTPCLPEEAYMDTILRKMAPPFWSNADVQFLFPSLKGTPMVTGLSIPMWTGACSERIRMVVQI